MSTELPEDGRFMSDTELARVLQSSPPPRPPSIPELMAEAVYGPRDDFRDRPTRAVCPVCKESLVPPHIADEWNTAMKFWLAAGAPRPRIDLETDPPEDDEP